MLHHLDEDGTMAVVLPHGVLFRGGAEGIIREFVLRRNWLDAVIGLPANIFYGTTIPTCIMVFRKCKETEDVLFIDASSCFLKGKNQNSLRDEDIERIVSAYQTRAEEDRFSHRASPEEIVENDFNLNLPRYIDIFQSDPIVDITVQSEASTQLHEVIDLVDCTISNLCQELGVEYPTAPNLALLQDFKRGLMQRLFSQEMRFTRDNGDAFPDWSNEKFGELFVWAKTNSLSREHLTRSNASGIQNIHYGDIHSKFRALFRQSAEDVPFITENAPLRRITDEEYLREGDIIIADASEDYADIGKSIEIMEVRESSMIAGLHTYIARPNEGVVVPGFAGYLLRSEPMRRQITRIAQGISVLGVSKKNLEKLTFWLPHPDEQQKIARVLMAVDAKIEIVSSQITDMETFRKGLLQKLFV